MFKIEYKNKLNDIETTFIDNEFEKYANLNNLETNYDTFNFIAYENNDVIGALKGITLYDEVHISNLIVAPEYRNKKIGTKLLNFASEHFSDKKWHYISLSTYNFQAPKFYEKSGFKLEYVRKNETNPELTKYFFIKYLCNA